MILKSYEIKKIKDNKTNIILFYGQNQGAKQEEINKLIVNNKGDLSKYEEKEIIDSSETFYDSILSKSLFNNKKTIIINRASDKILKIIEYINDKDLTDILIIIETGNLEKKSKLRSYFEKSKIYFCVPFYLDTQETLSKIISIFFKENNLSISNENINLILSRCLGDRGILKNELDKIKFFTKNKKKLTTENILKLTNLIENHSVSELVDNCLAKNKIKTLSIINENNLSPDEGMIIIRTFLQKLKRLLILCKEYKKNKDLNKTILNAKPPIFWKDREIVKQQISKWKVSQIYQMIYDVNNIELQIKKNFQNSQNLLFNFLLDKSSKISNTF